MDLKKIIPINVDRNLSVKDYEDYVLQRKLLVTSVFETIQGEGPFAGEPAIFVRLAGCNIGLKKDCPFCDTNFKYAEGTDWIVEELAKHLDSLSPKLVVITGGEPLLQYKMLGSLFDWLPRKRFQIETNGYLLNKVLFYATGAAYSKENSMPEYIYKYIFPSNVCFVVSPKAVDTKGKYKDLDFSLENLLYETEGHLFLKYVLTADEDSAYHTVPKQHMKFAREKSAPVYVSGMTVYKKAFTGSMPSIWDSEVVDVEATFKNYNYAAKYAMKHNLKVSLQTHLFMGME